MISGSDLYRRDFDLSDKAGTCFRAFDEHPDKYRVSPFEPPLWDLHRADRNAVPARDTAA